ncbi:hypothetical protein [Sphingomonas abietis]|uniref:HNH endonuclease n=1 Tax=Sphingomonas abietis TaxID=3012344 RepID=A0ABY7NQU4_9SPHN|nr:hypothetical protein [Sphingomonas abietis]WBO23905.1 hypothetical protein PBT88_07295 [Sphingomonas abietis]
MSDPANIARALSPAARERIMKDEDGNCPAGAAFQFLHHDLIMDHPTDPKGWAWSPLGAAVRAHLEASDNDRG